MTHPRCANCTVDAKAILIWTPAGETKPRAWGTGKIIHGGESRIGPKAIPCSTCDMTSTQAMSRHRHRACRHRPAACSVDFIWFSKGAAPRFASN